MATSGRWKIPPGDRSYPPDITSPGPFTCGAVYVCVDRLLLYLNSNLRHLQLLQDIIPDFVDDILLTALRSLSF
ncbi:hypothetical protein TNIN_402681 [Trichonephila inaurata madagascariensis]|uniref:Uncharacterized protein n=1 Tax=Trichonephila inaurata madagascariensis TaxID=2747483 RepID=A0A8X7BUJ9_9ARAC|nr:hypothetical protein TNIN_402681 [Trichonephila inaurata madagascariensis]